MQLEALRAEFVQVGQVPGVGDEGPISNWDKVHTIEDMKAQVTHSIGVAEDAAALKAALTLLTLHKGYFHQGL